jgi:hypothetical protein
MIQPLKRPGHKRFTAPLVFGVAVFAALAFAACESRNVQQREIVLITREVAFRSPDQPGQTNPVLTLRKGEPVKLVLRNEEISSVLHCFIITGLGIKTTRSLQAGESEATFCLAKSRSIHALVSGSRWRTSSIGANLTSRVELTGSPHFSTTTQS